MQKMRLPIARLEYALRFRLSCRQKMLRLKNYLVLTPKKPVAPHFFQKMGRSCGATQNIFSMYLPHCICYLCAKFQVATMISLGGVSKQTNKHTHKLLSFIICIDTPTGCPHNSVQCRATNTICTHLFDFHCYKSPF